MRWRSLQTALRARITTRSTPACQNLQAPAGICSPAAPKRPNRAPRSPEEAVGSMRRDLKQPARPSRARGWAACPARPTQWRSMERRPHLTPPPFSRAEALQDRGATRLHPSPPQGTLHSASKLELPLPAAAATAAGAIAATGLQQHRLQRVQEAAGVAARVGHRHPLPAVHAGLPPPLQMLAGGVVLQLISRVRAAGEGQRHAVSKPRHQRRPAGGQESGLAAGREAQGEAVRPIPAGSR